MKNPAAQAAGFFISCGSSEFGVGRTVGEKWVRHEVGVVNWRLAHLAGSIRAKSKPLESTIHIIQRGFDRGDAFVTEVGHELKLS